MIWDCTQKSFFTRGVFARATRMSEGTTRTSEFGDISSDSDGDQVPLAQRIAKRLHITPLQNCTNTSPALKQVKRGPQQHIDNGIKGNAQNSGEFGADAANLLAALPPAPSLCFASLLEQPSLHRLPLSSLKRLSSACNFEPGWRASHIKKAQLLPVLEKEKREHDAFVRSCRDEALTCLKRAVRGITSRTPARRQRQTRILEHVVAASVHLVPTGSGVLIEHQGNLAVLTCAHCINSGDDDDEEEMDEDSEGDDRAGGTVPARIGRCKSVVTATGDVLFGRCVRFDERSDLALLELYHPGERLAAAGASCCAAVRVHRAVVAPAAPVVDAPLMCVGNPYDWDLELPGGAAPRRNGYLPFTISRGKVDAPCQQGGRPSLGRLLHSCWTYWGHSGAPLFDQDGRIVGLHNSWDPDNDGQRHGVDWERIIHFLHAE